ncbi:DUF202 domain-containing protein [Balamuthia mandrillaris]
MSEIPKDSPQLGRHFAAGGAGALIDLQSEHNSTRNMAMEQSMEIGEEDNGKPSFFSTLFSNNITENKGSHARDHLANERTFLAWLRTALGAIGLGVAVAKLKLVDYSQLCGALFVIIGAVFLMYSTLRYFRVLKLLNDGFFEANKVGVGLVVALAGIATVVSMIIILL